MKVIDILNKIANGEEVPERIQVYSDIFVFDKYNRVYEHEETGTNLLSIYNGNILKYEVIIKDKKIEKIDERILLQRRIEDVGIPLKEMLDKINEIIDYLEDKQC